MNSFKPGDTITCLFNHDLIMETPIGPDVAPLKCPNVIRDLFYRNHVVTKISDLKLKLGFYTDNPTETLLRNTTTEFEERINSQVNIINKNPEPLKIIFLKIIFLPYCHQGYLFHGPLFYHFKFALGFA